MSAPANTLYTATTSTFSAATSRRLRRPHLPRPALQLPLRDLIGVLQREKADIGVYIFIEEPTKPMQREAAEASFYTSIDGSRYPRVQLLTIEGLMNGTQKLQCPLHVRDVTFKAAPRHLPAAATNLPLDLE